MGHHHIRIEQNHPRSVVSRGRVFRRSRSISEKTVASEGSVAHAPAVAASRRRFASLVSGLRSMRTMAAAPSGTGSRLAALDRFAAGAGSHGAVRGSKKLAGVEDLQQDLTAVRCEVSDDRALTNFAADGRVQLGDV